MPVRNSKTPRALILDTYSKLINEYLFNQTKLPDQLKDTFIKDTNNINPYNINKISDSKFNELMKELDNKHGVNNINLEQLNELKLKELINNRINININK